MTNTLRASVAVLLVVGMSCAKPGEKTQEDPRVARGRYLTHHVSLCFYCHGEVDFKKPGAPPKPERLGAGSVPFIEAGTPFLNVPNITPHRETGIGQWSDAEIRRALRQGVSRDGRRLFPVMPYFLFHSMSDADTDAVIAYLRTLKPVENKIPLSKFPPPLAAMLKGLPALPERAVPEPDRSSPAAYGKYLATAGLCADCHTPMTPQGQRIEKLAMAGGMALKGPWGEATSANLTTAPSGIPHYTEELFLQVMRTGNVGGRRLNPIMPWGYYHGMTDGDLKAVFAYLKTLPPIKHRVDNTTEPTPCPTCGGKHGLGEMNR